MEIKPEAFKSNIRGHARGRRQNFPLNPGVGWSPDSGSDELIRLLKGMELITMRITWLHDILQRLWRWENWMANYHGRYHPDNIGIRLWCLRHQLYLGAPASLIIMICFHIHWNALATCLLMPNCTKLKDVYLDESLQRRGNLQPAISTCYIECYADDISRLSVLGWRLSPLPLSTSYRGLVHSMLVSYSTSPLVSQLTYLTLTLLLFFFPCLFIFPPQFSYCPLQLLSSSPSHRFSPSFLLRSSVFGLPAKFYPLNFILSPSFYLSPFIFYLPFTPIFISWT